jgi:DNA-binding NarL/FixJ family response regulator
LKGALREVLQGRTYLSPAVTRDVLEVMGRMTSIRENVWAHLTPRQREVLQLLAEGKSHKEISNILNISVKTAEYHKYAILGTLGLKTNAELVQYAIRHGIIAV